MAITGTFNGWNIVAMPTNPGFRMVEFSINDAVSEVKSIFTGQSQLQQWPGADYWSATCTLPKLDRCDAANWVAFLMELRGKAGCFLLGDPMGIHPQGHTQGSNPVVNMTTGLNQQMTTSLVTRGWTASRFRLLLPGDYLQIGYRMHRVLDTVNSDSGGNATLNIWPSIRDPLTDGEQVILNAPKGLFRLATNQRQWSTDYTRLSSMSFQCVEAR